MQDLKNQFRSREPSKRSTETFPEEKKAFGNCLLDCDIKDTDKNEFPVFADIPYGTSIRQQKELFNQNIEELKKKHTSGQDVLALSHYSRISGKFLTYSVHSENIFIRLKIYVLVTILLAVILHIVPFYVFAHHMFSPASVLSQDLPLNDVTVYLDLLFDRSSVRLFAFDCVLYRNIESPMDQGFP